MCGHEHEHGARERHGFRRGYGFRGFGRRGFPSREEWLERLQAYQEHLESELKNVQDVIERLGSGGERPQEASLL
jgi:hypothetical protein